MSVVFSGEYEAKTDTKGRLVLPVRMRASLPEESQTLVLQRGFEPCLTVYPISEWEIIYKKVALLNEFNVAHRKFQRNFLRGTVETETDTQGRFLIPKRLLEYAKITKDVIIVGVGNRLEIWNPELYDEFLIKDQNEFSELAQEYLANASESVSYASHGDRMPQRAGNQT